MKRPAPGAASASANLETLLRRYARRSKRFRATWQATTETDSMAQAAHGLLTALVREAVAVIGVEEDSCCPYNYVLIRLELSDREMRPITEAIFDALVQDGLVTSKEERWRDIWANRDGSYYSAGVIGEPRQYVTLTEKGMAWAALVEEEK